MIFANDENSSGTQSASASATADLNYSVVEVTDTSATRTITLPPAAQGYPGRPLTVKDTYGQAGTNNVAVKTTGLSPDVDSQTWRLSKRTTGDATVRLITAAALPACTAAGTGVGKTLTGNAVGALSIDSVAVANADIVLIKNQVNAADNGIYVVTEKGVAVTTAFILTRKTTFDQIAEVLPGYRAKATAGTVNSGLVYALVGGIDDQTSIAVSTNYGSVTVFSDGTDWHQESAVSAASAGVDTTAIHVGTSGEIAGISAKSAPVSADLLIIEDSAASNAKKSVTIANAISTGRYFQRYTVSSAATDFTITGLNGDRDEVYEFIARLNLKSPDAGGGNIYLQPNGSAPNGVYTVIYSPSGVAAAAGTENNKWGAGTLETTTYLRGTIHAKTGQLRFYDVESSVPTAFLYFASGNWTNTADNLTSLKFVCTSRFDVGSEVVIYSAYPVL